MTCRCNSSGQQAPQVKGTVGFCDICDPCNESVSNVRLCAFIVPTLEEGRYYKNSFIFVQEDDSVYYINENRSEVPFGSRPKFIDNFDPTDTSVHFKSTVVYDLPGHIAHVYDPKGNRQSFSMTSTPITNILAGAGILVNHSGGDYTISVDGTVVASATDLSNVTQLVTNHTGQISTINTTLAGMATTITNLEEEVEDVHDIADDANEKATLARTEAQSAQQTATSALSQVAGKQDALTAGENISITNNVISAAVPAYGKATVNQNGLMSNKDREQMINTGLYAPSSQVSPSSTDVTLAYTHKVSDADGSAYTSTVETVVIPGATTTTSGVMSSNDKTKLDGLVVNDGTLTIQQNGESVGTFTANQSSSVAVNIETPVVTYTTTDPGEGQPLAANHFIVVHGA